jgi:hypothetical protein
MVDFHFHDPAYLCLLAYHEGRSARVSTLLGHTTSTRLYAIRTYRRSSDLSGRVLDSVSGSPNEEKVEPRHLATTPTFDRVGNLQFADQ